MPVRTLITGAGDLWVGIARVFRDAPLDGTLIVMKAYGQAQTKATLCACRNWLVLAIATLQAVGLRYAPRGCRGAAHRQFRPLWAFLTSNCR